jgi:hypothetical protein
MTQVTMDELMKQGFENTNECFAIGKILKRGNERILYDPLSKEIIFKYSFKKETA